MCWNAIQSGGAVRGCSSVMLLVLAGLTVGLGAAECAWSQDEPAQEQGPELSGMSTSTGLGFYFPERWGLAEATVQNPGEEPIRPRVRVFFSDQPERLFDRRVWVPPRAERRMTLPMRFGGSVRGGSGGSEDARSAEITSILLDGEASGDRELDRWTALSSIVKRRRPFAMVTSLSRARGENHTIKTMSKIRERRRLPSRMGYIRDRSLMRFEAAWGGIEVLTFTAAAPRFDAAQKRALRRWVRQGGTLVIFAHEADPATMRRVLGESWSINRIDRVTLNTVEFREARDGRAAAAAVGTAAEGAERASITVEEPIPMARVVAPGYRAWLTVRGWPALLTRSMGRGRIVVPTVSGRAWRHEGADEALGVLGEAILGEMGDQPVEGETARVARGEAGEAFVSQQIGYKVVSRPVVAGVMGAFIAALIAGTLLWMRGGRLERLGPFGVVAAVVTMGVLLAMGQRAREQIPATRAGLQVIPASPGASRVPVRGLMGLFDPSGQTRTVRARAGSSAWPPVSGGIRARAGLTVEDFNRMAWRDLPLPQAVLGWMEYDAGAQLDRPLKISLRYGGKGLTGTMRAPSDRAFQDGLLVTERATLGVSLKGDSASSDGGRVRIGPAQVRPKGVLLAKGGISKTERERASFVRSLLEEVDFPEPTLLTWSTGLKTGVGIEPELKRREHALWSIPLRPEPTPAGESVRVPWPLVRMEPLHERAGELGLSMRPVYSPSRGWSETDASTAFVARFTVPRAVRPMELTEAVVHLNMSAIGREVEILAIRNGEPSVVETVSSPDGPTTVRIPPDRLSFDDRGGLIVAFRVGGIGRTASSRGERQYSESQFWKVERFGLEVAGTKREDE